LAINIPQCSAEDPSTTCMLALSAPTATVGERDDRFLPAKPLSAGGNVAFESPLVIAHLFPDLLNLYGDRGNVTVLRMRCAWRGIPVEVRELHLNDEVDLSGVDLLFIGGGPDERQRIAYARLEALGDQLRDFVEEDGALLAICGGYQMLGKSWVLDGVQVEGIGVFGAETRRDGEQRGRLVGDFALESPLSKTPVVGFENHAGRTFLDAEARPFGRVISKRGHGNNDFSRADGAVYRKAIGTYAHGPLLSKNPEVADLLIGAALKRREERTGLSAPDLTPLDDSEENAAKRFVLERMGVAT